LTFEDAVSGLDSFYIDKSLFIPELEQCGPEALLLAPSGFGKHLFLGMLSKYYDLSVNQQEFDSLFGRLSISSSPTSLRGHFYVIELDFVKGALDTSSLASFHNSLSKTINSCLESFYVTHRNVPAITMHRDGVASLESFISTFQRYSLPLMILVNGYDHHLSAISPKGRRSLRDLTTTHAEHGDMLEMMDLAVKKLFDVIKGAVSSGNTRSVICGVHPLSLSMPHVSRSPSKSQFVNFHPKFARLFGMEKRDVQNALDLIRPPLNQRTKEDLCDWLEDMHGGYRLDDTRDSHWNPSNVARFSPPPPDETLFHTGRTMASLNFMQYKMRVSTTPISSEKMIEELNQFWISQEALKSIETPYSLDSSEVLADSTAVSSSAGLLDQSATALDHISRNPGFVRLFNCLLSRTPASFTPPPPPPSRIRHCLEMHELHKLNQLSVAGFCSVLHYEGLLSFDHSPTPGVSDVEDSMLPRLTIPNTWARHAFSEQQKRWMKMARIDKFKNDFLQLILAYNSRSVDLFARSLEQNIFDASQGESINVEQHSFHHSMSNFHP
jgi:hypothetical protein